MASAVTQALIAQLEQRDATGLAKYGVTLDRADLTVEQWLDHQVEELLDAAGYALSAKREIAKLRERIRELEAENTRLTEDVEQYRTLLRQAQVL